jgi:hypothetical protein
MPARHVSTLTHLRSRALRCLKKKRSGKRFFYDLFDRDERLSERRLS